jgi:hypothetical protein
VKQASAFDQCRRDFNKLSAPVNDDPLAQTTVADLVSAALFELDLHEEGEQDPALTARQVLQLRRFLAKWRTVPETQAVSK